MGGGNLFAALEHQKTATERTVGILKLRDLIDREGFRPVLEVVTGYDTKDWKRGGRPPFDPLLMLKILVLQKHQGLSDKATEDRLSFMSFLGLPPGDEVPDANTIWNFKELIEKDKRDGSQSSSTSFSGRSTARVSSPKKTASLIPVLSTLRANETPAQVHDSQVFGGTLLE